jgi:hypothetical protein
MKEDGMISIDTTQQSGDLVPEADETTTEVGDAAEENDKDKDMEEMGM